MKTDLAKILTVTGSSALYEFVAQARNGAIAETIKDKKRTIFDLRSRISSLADIAIYTSEGEVRLKEVFLKMKEVLGDEPAPSPKASADEFKSFFAKALPDYDEDRFYVSHMKKVADWYNQLSQYASLDFVDEEEASAEETAE